MGGISKFNSNAKALTSSIDSEKEVFRNIVTGKMYSMMRDTGISKTELSQRLHTSKSATTMLLSGDRNFTIDKVVEVASALGYTPHIEFRRKGDTRSFFEAYCETTKVECLSCQGTKDSDGTIHLTQNYSAITKQIQYIAIR